MGDFEPGSYRERRYRILLELEYLRQNCVYMRPPQRKLAEASIVNLQAELKELETVRQVCIRLGVKE